jgi:5,5'-dehydrodivanillate O-demethylase
VGLSRPEPRPLVPDWEFFSWPNGFRQIVKAELPCNWFQCQENSIDPVHFEWTHSNWSVRARRATGPYTPQHVKVDFSEFEYGFQYKRIRTDTTECDALWTIGRVCLWPNALFTGNHIEFRVPVDDENTLSLTGRSAGCRTSASPMYRTASRPGRGRSPTRRPALDHQPHHEQDFVTWVGQGRVADRSKEYLAPSDRGVVMMRRRFLHDLEAVAQGRDPKAVLRDPAVNRAIPLPVAERDALITGFTAPKC